MFNTMCQTILLLVFLGGFSVRGVKQVSGVFIYTESEVETFNGTDVKLKGTVRSSHPVSPTSVSVTWLIRPVHSESEESGVFKGRVVWSGDVMGRDASITLQQVSLTLNGTYICRVRNRPDVHSRNGEVVPKVIYTASFDPYDWLVRNMVW